MVQLNCTVYAVAGEAAGIALGLLYAGSGSDKAGELLAYAHDTQASGQASQRESAGLVVKQNHALLLVRLAVCRVDSLSTQVGQGPGPGVRLARRHGMCM